MHSRLPWSHAPGHSQVIHLSSDTNTCLVLKFFNVFPQLSSQRSSSQVCPLRSYLARHPPVVLAPYPDTPALPSFLCPLHTIHNSMCVLCPLRLLPLPGPYPLPCTWLRPLVPAPRTAPGTKQVPINNGEQMSVSDSALPPFPQAR